MGPGTCIKSGMKTIHPKYRLRRKQFLVLILPVILTIPCLAQPSHLFPNASLAEKIYLQLDSKAYTTDESIWFKAIVAGAADHVPTGLSGVLYVELIGPDESIVEKKIVKLEKGIGDGFFQLQPNYIEGTYLVRAYTQWDKNFGNDFFYKEYIRVFASTTYPKPTPIANVTLVREPSQERRLEATLNPFAIDSLHKKALTLILSFEDRRDTIAIMKNKEDQYLLNYALPDTCRFVTLQMETKNHLSFSKTIVLDKDYLDLQFFPESGELVQGLQSVVGFKALDYSGKGRKVEGEIVNGRGEVITLFKSNELGMGTFTITDADPNAIYSARLMPVPEKGISKMYPLPKVALKGNVLSVRKDGNRISVKASSNDQQNDSITIWASCRGVAYYSIKGHPDRGNLAFLLPSNSLPEGIIAFTMMNKQMEPVAERLYFNERPESRINIAISSDKDIYEQREPTKLAIETTDKAGNPVNANVSVLVLNKAQMGEMQDTRQHILSYFLVNSDLKGDIENPGYYFAQDEDRFSDLDALLLTQGWRKYNYTHPRDRIRYPPEAMLTVTGTVKEAINREKRKNDIELTLMTFGHNHSVQVEKVDSLGRFSFDVNDEYGQNVNIMIQSTNKAGKKKECTITLDKKESPAISFNHVNSIEKPDSVVDAFVEKNIERKKVDEAFPLSKGTIFLDEVTVQGYNMTPARKKMADEYGKPDEVIEGETIQAREEKWSYGLYSVLLFNFPDKVRIIRDSDGTLYAWANNPDPTFIVIDGIPVMFDDYPLIPNIPPGEVKSFEVIENAKNFRELYSKVLPENYMNWLLEPGSKTGNVIAIYTYAGKGLSGVIRTIGILKTAVPVFSASREFYEPKYPNLKTEDWFKPDLRALVHWEPKLRVDNLGKASTSFYNADYTGKMEVVIEAISDKGEIGYQEMEYEVSKRKF